MGQPRKAPPICADKRWHRHSFFEKFTRTGEGSSHLAQLTKVRQEEHLIDQSVDLHEVDRWSGVLSGIPNTRYLLICRHLRASELDKQVPWKPPEIPTATHEWLCLCQRRTLETPRPLGGIAGALGLEDKRKKKIQQLTGGQEPAVVWFHAYHDLGYEAIAKAKRSMASLRHTAILRAEQESDQRAWEVTHKVAWLIQKISESRAGVPGTLGDWVLGSVAAEPDEIRAEVDDVERFWVAAFTVALKP